MSSSPSERSLISLERRCLCGVFMEAAITMDPWPDSNGRITSSLVTVRVHNLGGRGDMISLSYVHVHVSTSESGQYVPSILYLGFQCAY